MATRVTQRGSKVFVALVALLNSDILKHRPILVDSCLTRRGTGEAMSTRNWPTLNSSTAVHRSVDDGTGGCAEGGFIVLADVGLRTACGASRAGSKSDADQSAGPLPLALRGRYTDSTCKKSFMSNVAARTDLSMCAWTRTLSTTPYTTRLNIWYKVKTHRQI